MVRGIWLRRLSQQFVTGDRYLKSSAGSSLLRQRRSAETRQLAAKDGASVGNLDVLRERRVCGSSLLSPSISECTEDRPRIATNPAARSGSCLAGVEGIRRLAFYEAFRGAPSRTFTGSSLASPARMEGKVAVVTGAASGIGEATVRAFVENGARVVIADIQDGPGQQLAEELGGDAVARYVHCDVTDEAQVAAALDLAVEAFGRLDVLHNNAGLVGAQGPIDKLSGDHWDATFRILVKSYFLGIKHAARIMKARGVGGSIINTASVGSIVGGLTPHCYAACKHAVVGLTKSAAVELRDYRVRVNAISPHVVGTPFVVQYMKAGREAAMKADPNMAAAVAAMQSEGSGGINLQTMAAAVKLTGVGEMIPTAAIANVAVFLASDEATFTNGQNLVVDGSYALAPAKPPVIQMGLWGAPGMLGASDKSRDSPDG